jgi:hypothetical protein
MDLTRGGAVWWIGIAGRRCRSEGKRVVHPTDADRTYTDGETARRLFLRRVKSHAGRRSRQLECRCRNEGEYTGECDDVGKGCGMGDFVDLKMAGVSSCDCNAS